MFVLVLGIQFALAVECGSAPTDGCEVTTNTVFTPGNYNLPNGLVINASSVSLDCNGATLNGSGVDSAVGIYMDGSVGNRDFNTIKNCNIQNYDSTANNSRGIQLHTGVVEIVGTVVDNINFSNNDQHFAFSGPSARNREFNFSNNYFGYSDGMDTYSPSTGNIGIQSIYFEGISSDDSSYAPEVGSYIYNNQFTKENVGGVYVAKSGATWSDCRDDGINWFNNLFEIPFYNGGSSVCADFYSNLINYTHIPGTQITFTAPYVDLSKSELFKIEPSIK